MSQNKIKTHEELMEELSQAAPIHLSTYLCTVDHPKTATLHCGSVSLCANSDKRILLSIDAKDLRSFIHTCDDLRDLCQMVVDYLQAGGSIDNTTDWRMVLEDSQSEHSH